MTTPTITARSLDTLSPIHPNAAGLDIGADEIFAGVPSDRDRQPVRAFATFTVDLHAQADWLEQCGIDTVAMESTGIYWVPIYEILEARGMRVFLVNATQIKIPPGRKSDWKDCQWIQRLHTLGLLEASFRPDAEMAILRSYLRHRAELIEHRAPHILHMQRALHHMNIQLDRVLTDITATTGMAILRAIVATAYKIARTVYTMLKEHRAFHDIGAVEYDQRYREREVQYLQRKAAKLGFDLTPKLAIEPAPG